MSKLDETLHDVTKRLIAIKKVVIVKNDHDGTVSVEVDHEPTPALEQELKEAVTLSEWFKSKRRSEVSVKFSNGEIMKI